MEDSIINKLGLTKKQVCTIVKEWYLNGSFPGILQGEYGEDLEEIIDVEIEVCDYEEKHWLLKNN